MYIAALVYVLMARKKADCMALLSTGQQTY